jgi:hypothetical protein
MMAQAQSHGQANKTYNTAGLAPRPEEPEYFTTRLNGKQ